MTNFYGFTTVRNLQCGDFREPERLIMEASNIELRTREEAEKVLAAVIDIVHRYDNITVADIKEIVGLPTTHEHHKWGWKSSVDFRIRQTRNGYSIDFPNPVELGDKKEVKRGFIMDEEIINDLAFAFAQTMTYAYTSGNREYYEAAILDDIAQVAEVIKKHAPSYDIQKFYTNAGYFGRKMS